ncbi:uncharacterized protein METZ01_LOCUS369196, partial [marine metagenome]
MTAHGLPKLVLSLSNIMLKMLKRFIKYLFPNRSEDLMRPPNCCLCEKGLDTNEECELLTFIQLPTNVIKSAQGSAPLPDHPEHQEWFCLFHHPLATQFKHLTRNEAVTQLSSIVEESIDQLEKVAPALDDLFLSECPACGSQAAWLGIVEEERELETFDLGTLMHCPDCSDRFLLTQGALQQFLKNNPPLFIPGRRIS